MKSRNSAMPSASLPLRRWSTALAALLLAGCAAAAQADREAPAAPRAVPFERDPDSRLEQQFDDEMTQVLESLDALDERIDDLDLERMIAAVDAGERSAAERYAERQDSEASGAAIDERRSLKADGRVSINNVAGLVDVTTWDRNEVGIAGRLGSRDDRLEIQGDGNALSIVVRLPKKARGGDTVLRLQLPVQARVEVETVSADVVVNGARGALKVNTVSGDVALSVGSPDVQVQTVSGDLKLDGPARSTRLNSVSGDLELSGLGGVLSLETVSGNVDLRRGGRFTELQLKSVSGDLRLDVDLADAARLGGQTLSGEISLIVPQALSGTALLKSFSGEAHCEGAKAVDNHGGKKREYVWGDGRGARIELSSFSGDIRVERR